MLNFLTRTLFVALLAGASVVSTHASADGDGIISSERPSGQAVALGWEIVDAGRNIEIGEQEYVTLVCTGSIDVEFNSAWTDGSDDNVSGPFQFTAAGRDLTLKIGHSLDETYTQAGGGNYMFLRAPEASRWLKLAFQAEPDYWNGGLLVPLDLELNNDGWTPAVNIKAKGDCALCIPTWDEDLADCSIFGSDQNVTEFSALFPQNGRVHFTYTPLEGS